MPGASLSLTVPSWHGRASATGTILFFQQLCPASITFWSRKKSFKLGSHHQGPKKQFFQPLSSCQKVTSTFSFLCLFPFPTARDKQTQLLDVSLYFMSCAKMVPHLSLGARLDFPFLLPLQGLTLAVGSRADLCRIPDSCQAWTLSRLQVLSLFAWHEIQTVWTELDTHINTSHTH